MTATIAPAPIHRPSHPAGLTGPPVPPSMHTAPRAPQSVTAILRGLVAAARPHQWIKNGAVLIVPGLVLASLGIAGTAVALAATLAFCLASSSVYLLNDVADRSNDRHHPTKRNRPVASGLVSPRLALVAAAVLGCAALVLGFALASGLGAVILAYLVITAAYSNGLKRIAYLDAAVLATGFVLRVVAGAVAVGAGAPLLLLIAVFAGAAFIALGKRQSELLLLGEDAAAHRFALRTYRQPQLAVTLRATEATTVLAFGLWVLTAIGGPVGLALGVLGAMSLFRALDAYRLSLQQGRGADPTMDIASNLAVLSGLGLAAAVALSTGVLR